MEATSQVIWDYYCDLIAMFYFCSFHFLLLVAGANIGHFRGCGFLGFILVSENLHCLLFLSLLYPTELTVIYVLVGGNWGLLRLINSAILVLVG